MSSIELKNLCLDYIIKREVESIRKIAIRWINRPFRKTSNNNEHIKIFRVLNDINLKINQGDRIGLLGRNGSGKSTLLRVLANIYKPNQGIIKIEGKIWTLFDVNLGMNPEATGYENIINLALMRGVPKKTAQGIIRDIETFTELGDFLNNPVRTYSTGMRMKLAFAVATSTSPEILLIDEVIGVGDMHFVEKATERLGNMIDTSHILVLASHANDFIRKFCNKLIVLDRGEIQFLGGVGEGIEYYQNVISSY